MGSVSTGQALSYTKDTLEWHLALKGLHNQGLFSSTGCLEH